MGLDMHLTGTFYVSKDWDNPANNEYFEGHRLKGRTYDLGYWRKHPDLHGFIVEKFADGIDDCKQIYLDCESIDQILAAIATDQLPTTVGFFFGESTNDDEQKAEAIEVFTKARQWLQNGDWHRSVYYQASW